MALPHTLINNTIADADEVQENFDQLNKYNECPYKFSVYRDAAANTGAGAYAKITFDTELYDNNNNFSGGTYTVPVTGYYHFNARASVGAVHNRLILSLYKNGTELLRGGDIEIASVTNGSVLLSADIKLTSGDTIEMYIYGNAAVALEVADPKYTYFQGHLLSA